MNHKKIRTIFCLTVLALTLLFAVPALGDIPAFKVYINGNENKKPSNEAERAALPRFNESTEMITVPIWIENTGSDTQTVLDIQPDISSTYLIQGAVTTTFDGSNDIASSSGKMFMVTCPLIDGATVNPNQEFILRVYNNSRDSKEVYFNITRTQVTEATPTPNSSKVDEDIKALTLDSIGADGQVVAAPAGDAGDKVTLRLPIKCRQGVVSGAEITPVLSSDLNEFPFVIEAVDYTRKLPTLGVGNVAELQYEMTISKEATSGVKGITFNAIYYKNGVLETNTFKVYVNVLKGKSEEIKDKDGNLITSMPKLIVESYSIKPTEPQEGDPEGRLFAGEPFLLEFTVRNTSDKESVQNIQMTLSNTNNTILPANGSSNAMYIKSIGKGDKEKCSIELQSVPDADGKPQNLTIAFDYEGAQLQKQYSTQQDLTLAVAQRMRVKIDAPAVYGDGLMPGSTAGVSFGIYNQGKGTIYNCMIDVEGAGLQMEESVSGGNITAGNNMRADFNIIANEPGDIEGKIIVTYEDVYQEQTRVELPISLYVMDDSAMMEFETDPMMGEEVMGEGQPSGGIPWLWIGIGGAVLAALIVLLILRKKKRRKRELEDE